MRLREMANYTSDINETHLLTLDNKYIENLNNFKGAIELLQFIPIFFDEIILLKSSSIYTTSGNYFSVDDDNERRQIFHLGNDLLTKAQLLSQLSDQIYPTLSDISISLLLPKSILIEDLNSYLKDFDTAFNFLIVNEYINSNVTLENWEHGSFWINLGVGSLVAVTVISSAAWSAAVVSKKFAEHEYVLEQVRSLSLKNDSLEDMVHKQKEATTLLIQQEARAIYDEHYDSTDDNEQITKIEKSIKLLAELIQKGAQVNPALSAPEDVKNLFPDYSKPMEIISNIKLLEGKSE